MDIPGWIRLSPADSPDNKIWIQTRHIVGVGGDKARTVVGVLTKDAGLYVRETVDEVMRLIDAANPP